MPYRKVPLAKNELYHVFSKSIADFKVFNNAKDYERILDEFAFYVIKNQPCSFSFFKKAESNFNSVAPIHLNPARKLVEIIAYCIMPTHIHLILEQLTEKGISKFVTLILQSYTRYFNKKHNRKGPLWEGRFKNVLIENEDQFLHLTRYIHLNPVTAYLVENPLDWQYSSCKEYVGLVKNNKVCTFSQYFDMDAPSYEKFVTDRIGYQRELAVAKNLLLE